MEEIWKDIKGYEGLYQVSNLGKIKSLGRTIERIGPNGKKFYRNYPSKIIKIALDTKGYYRTNLAKNGINKTVKIHRIVAEAFIPNTYNKPQINHIDGNKQNNNVNNLEWCTNKENQDHSWRNGLRKKGKEHWSYGKVPKQLLNVIGSGNKNPNYGNRGNKNPLSKTIMQYDLDNNLITIWIGIQEAGRELRISAGSICNCCKGKRKTAGNYIWKYA